MMSGKQQCNLSFPNKSKQEVGPFNSDWYDVALMSSVLLKNPAHAFLFSFKKGNPFQKFFLCCVSTVNKNDSFWKGKKQT